MLNALSRTQQQWLGSALLVTAIVILCVRFLDIPLALFVRNRIYCHAQWSRLTSELPDLLLTLVLATTLVACSLYLGRSKKGIFDNVTSFARLVTWTAPLSYLAKWGLKFVFGRVDTRYWLEEPALYGFHWFQSRVGCDGFPSGHMIVIVALLAALRRFYPKCRPFCLVATIMLGAVLIATNYHFLSDVIAGAYVGVLIEALICRLLIRQPPRIGYNFLFPNIY
jgi:membrane-associated phospholipid phosphatase